jgi:hypothetical protein
VIKVKTFSNNQNLTLKQLITSYGYKNPFYYYYDRVGIWYKVISVQGNQVKTNPGNYDYDELVPTKFSFQNPTSKKTVDKGETELVTWKVG